MSREVRKIQREALDIGLIRPRLTRWRHARASRAVRCRMEASTEALATASNRASGDAGANASHCSASVESEPVQLLRRTAARCALACWASSIGTLFSWTDTPTRASRRSAVSSDTLGRFPCSNSLISRGLTPASTAKVAMESPCWRRASRRAVANVSGLSGVKDIMKGCASPVLYSIPLRSSHEVAKGNTNIRGTTKFRPGVAAH